LAATSSRKNFANCSRFSPIGAAPSCPGMALYAAAFSVASLNFNISSNVK
jgi:hypothetical protein